MNVKTVIFRADLGFGRSAWVERNSLGYTVAKADLHPDDPTTLFIGTARSCFKIVQSFARAAANNRMAAISVPRGAR